MAGSRDLYSKSFQLMKQLEQKAKEVTKKKSDAEGRLQIAEQLLDRCKSVNAETASVEKAVAEAVAALDGKDWDLALEKSGNALETAKKVFAERIHSILSGADEIIQIVAEVGEEPAQLKQLKADTKAALDSEDFDVAIKLAEQTYDASQKALHEQYAKAYSRAQQIILKAKDLGENVEDLQKDLQSTKAMVESEDYTTAITSLKTAMELGADMLKTRIASDVDSIEDSVLSAEDMGSEVSKLKEMIARARELLASKDFDEAMSYARRAQSETEKSVSGRIHEETRRLRDDARTTKKHGGEVDSVLSLVDTATKQIKDHQIAEAGRNLEKARQTLKETQFKIVLQSISKSKDNFVLAKKLGVDISGAITLLNESRERLQKGQFEEAVNAAEEADKEIENCLGAFRQAQEGVGKLSAEIKDLEEMGIRMPSDMNYFQEARDALSEKDFAVAAEKATIGLETIDKFLRQAAEEKVHEAGEAITLASQLKADVAAAKEFLNAANDQLAEQNAAEALKSAIQSIDISNVACHEFIADTISSFEAFLDEVSKAFDVAEYRSGLSEAKEMVESMKFVEALEKIGEIKNGVEKKGAEESKRLIGDAGFKIGELDAAGIDAADLRLMISKAEEFFGQGNLDKAVATAKEAIKDADATIEDLAKKTLFTLKTVLEDAKQDDLDTTKWRGLYKQSKDMLDLGEFSSSYQTSKRILDQIGEYGRQHQAVLSKMKKCEELLVEAAKSKIDVSGPAKLLADARAALNDIDIEKVGSMVDEAERGIEGSMGMYLTAKMIMVLKSSLEYAQREGIDVGSTGKFLGESKSFMKERKYDSALAAAKRAQAEISGAFKAKTEAQISEIHATIADARNVGVDVSRPEKLLEKAREELDQSDFENAVKSTALARDEIDQIRDLSSKSAMEIRIARERIRDAEAIGLDMSEPRALLDQAIDSLNSHKYAISFEFARKISTQATEVIKKDLDRLFNKLSKRIAGAEKDGAEIDGAQGLLAEAKKAYGTMEFQDAIKLVMQCEQELDRADLQHAIATNALDVASKRLDEAERDMLIVTKAKKIYENARAAMTKKRFAEVIELAISLGDEIERARHQIDDCRLDLNALDERIARLNRIGLEIPSVEALRENADHALQSAEFSSCREICIEAEKTISVELEQIINAKLNQATGLIETGRQLGLDDKECPELLSVAQTSAKEGLWDFAYEQTQKCVSKISSSLSEKLNIAVGRVMTKMSVVRKTGASVKLVEDQLANIEQKMESAEFEEAFKMVVDAESVLSKIESLHKDYIDAKYAAESAVTMAKKFGIPLKEGERLMSMAEVERDKDYVSAIEMLKDAAEMTRGSLDKFNPEIAVTIKPVELKREDRGTISINVTNKGRALAKDLKLEFHGGNIDVMSMPEIPALRPGENKDIDISVTPKQSGEFEMGITIAAKRLFDGKSFEFSARTPVRVLQREPTARTARATEPATCTSCNGKIKAGFDIAVCLNCNGVEHLACAKRTKKCGSCGASLEF